MHVLVILWRFFWCSMSYDVGVDVFGSTSICLHRNENLFVDPAFLQRLAMQAAKEMSFSSYPESMSYRLRKAIGNSYGYSPEEVYVGNGADGVLADLFQLLREEYDEVGTQQITYRIYPYLFNRYGFKQRRLNDTSGLWVIDSPNSVTGEVFSLPSKEPELLIWDNVYGEYVAGSEIKSTPNRVVVHSFSKFYALAALRIGYCFASPDLVARLLQRKDVFNVNGFAQRMAELALENRAYFESLVPKVHESRKKLIEGLDRFGFKISGKANFIWISHPRMNMKILQRQLQDASIFVRRFDEPELENFVRITVPPLSQINHLLRAIYDCFSSL